MRLLALAGIVLTLAGCSLPYEGTSFKANPAIEKSTVIEHGEKGGEAAGLEGKTPEGSPGNTAAVDGAAKVSAPDPTLGQNGTGSVFPTTAQPGQ